MKLIPCLGAVCALLLASCAGPMGSHSEYGDRAGPKAFRTVVIDAGHGGKDSGARGRLRGQPEKTVALDIAQRLRDELRSSFKVAMTRTSDTFVPLDDRVRIANRSGDAVLISIHLNDGTRRLAGSETYWWRVDSYSLAKRVHAAMRSVATGSNNRGMVRRRLRLTRNPEIPCILVECGYLSNATDSAYLATGSYRQRLAQAIASAIRDQSAHGDAGSGTLPKPIYAAKSSAHDARE
ncbi:MAG: N-acetylmuramoyl-L-alanine amidase [Verrucomicrobiaceae bacterium]|nr:N-acetylmuramoyl-L-alanine amidase [Verrucomicrobiaceae bacterium]